MFDFKSLCAQVDTDAGVHTAMTSRPSFMEFDVEKLCALGDFMTTSFFDFESFFTDGLFACNTTVNISEMLDFESSGEQSDADACNTTVNIFELFDFESLGAQFDADASCSTSGARARSSTRTRAQRRLQGRGAMRCTGSAALGCRIRGAAWEPHEPH
jgi:hypothetical protein